MPQKLPPERPASRKQLGNFGFSTKGELDLDSGMSKHSNQSINTESFNLSSDQVAHPWLGHSKQTCGLSLRESPRADKFADLNHQISSDLEILCFLARESEVSKYVAGRLSNFDCHEIS
jgi:hypothetical protein